VLLIGQLFGLFPFLSHIFADGGYAGDKLKNALQNFGSWCIEIVSSRLHRKQPLHTSMLPPSCFWYVVWLDQHDF